MKVKRKGFSGETSVVRGGVFGLSGRGSPKAMGRVVLSGNRIPWRPSSSITNCEGVVIRS